MPGYSFTRYLCGVCREQSDYLSHCRKGRGRDQCGLLTNRWTPVVEEKRWEDLSYEERQKIAPGYDD